MMNRSLTVAALLALAAAGCSRQETSETAAQRPASVDIKTVGLQVPKIPYGAVPGGMTEVIAADPQKMEVSNPEAWDEGPYRMIATEDRWKALWMDLSPGSAAPEVDFSRTNVVVVRHLAGEPAPRPWVVSSEGLLRVVLDPETLVSSAGRPAEVSWFAVPTDQGPIASISLQSSGAP